MTVVTVAVKPAAAYVTTVLVFVFIVRFCCGGWERMTLVGSVLVSVPVMEELMTTRTRFLRFRSMVFKSSKQFEK